MRGCLSVLIIAAAFLVGIVWFGGPPLAETVVEATLTSSGFRADDVEVTVRSDPPLKLALGQADEVSIEGRNVRWNDLRAESLSLTLGDVDLLDRTAVSAAGFLDNAELSTGDGGTAVGSVEFEGPADAAEATVSVNDASVQALAVAAFEREFGSRPEAVMFSGPNVVRVRTAAGTLEATLDVTAGALVVRSGLGTVVLVDPGPSAPITLTGVSIADGALVLTGEIDLLGLMD